MQDLTKAQITIGLFAFFATMWGIFKQMLSSTFSFDTILVILVLFVVLMLLSYILLGILQWVKIFDLKTNAIITLITLLAIGFSATLQTLIIQ